MNLQTNVDSRPALIGNQVPNYYSAIKIDSETASEAHYNIGTIIHS
jgi:hypothetical protein